MCTQEKQCLGDNSYNERFKLNRVNHKSKLHLAKKNADSTQTTQRH